MSSPHPDPTAPSATAPAPGPVEFSVEAILFDLDGTLIDSTGSVERNWGKLADRLGVPFAELEHHIHGVPLAQVLRRLYPGRYTEEEIAGHAAFLSEGESTDTAGIVAQPGARELLERLPADRWTIVTSGDSRLAPARIAAAGLPTPAGMVTADQVALGKPHPEPYLLGAQRLGREPGRCLVLEDAPAGVAAAKAAGCPVIGLLTTHSELDTLVAPSLQDVHITVRENDLLVRVG
ncbi:HAD-IA family hydrolase [Nakamurella flavida]|uniref:HAD-IA family hydrolase n=1 Tax=Nakamurella flavida TaxID=363630 RepID=A0A938YMM5_9ACTN|nr:HAD-IA family hydrolase [Nakamurella flavida]MBM9475690.1 HAD-IA family hydrolase [Nakamurella flavida]MDP9778033.1 sugar-phosphatase [Nakamurella flavida]